ncbi:MAG: MerC domain-containing protein [Chloroherpetonaceae bacterium]|nr:MerC domain-containing protein [Chloroherpetonaceae bacterium]MDW8438440.1 MerC domain-containing protein [Chloroherpetonaceae bacterium]
MKRHLFDIVNLDALGFSASAICALHCLAMPFVITLLPVIGLSFLAHPAFEASLIVSGLLIGALSLWHGYSKHHRSLLPMAILSAGFGLIALGHLEALERFEFFIVFFGASCVAVSHVLNHRLMKHEKECPH